MKLIDKIKELFRRSKTPRLNPGEQNIPQFETQDTTNYLPKPHTVILTQDGEQSLFIHSIVCSNQFMHSDGEICNLMIARAYHKEHKNDTLMIGGTQERTISFEITAGEPITETILNKIAGYYMYEKNQPTYRDDFSYLGRLSQDPNDLSIKKSQTVQNYINTNIIPQIEMRKREQNERKKESYQQSVERTKSQEEQFRERARQNNIEYENRINRIRQSRLQNPFLRYQNTIQHNGKSYSNYSGIDLNSGDILRVRNLDTIGADNYGTYLYKADVYRTPDESDAERLGFEVKNAQPICFTTNKRVEDILKDCNSQEISGLLRLLAVPDERNAQNGYEQGELYYSGDLSNGQVNPGRNVSSQISNAILQLQARVHIENNRMVQRENNDNEQQI